MKPSIINTLTLVIAISSCACSGSASKKTDDTVKTTNAFTVHINSSAWKTDRTVKTSKSSYVDPETQDSIITEDSVIHKKTVVKHSFKK